MATAQTPPRSGGPARVDEVALPAKVAEALNRWPAAGPAVAVVRDERLAWFHGHGVSNVTTGRAVTEDTAFRIGSLTKTVTAVAIMQLRERGLVDLDAPANDYLTTFQLTLLRHLLSLPDESLRTDVAPHAEAAARRDVVRQTPRRARPKAVGRCSARRGRHRPRVRLGFRRFSSAELRPTDRVERPATD